jgi:cysteine desulfurase
MAQDAAVSVEKPSIYLDYQASTPIDPDALRAMLACLSDTYGNPHSTEHMFGWRASDAVETSRAQVGELVGADAEDIIFTSGATEANNLAILGIGGLRPATRDTVLVGCTDHASVIEPARELERRGYRLIEIGVDAQGFLRDEDLDAELSERVLLVSISAVNHEIGTIQNITRIGERCRAVGALFHTDASQALAAMDFTVNLLPVDFASFSAHKIYGPKGIGALYVAPGRGKTLVPLILGGGQQRGLRAGTLPAPLCVGFGVASSKLGKLGRSERPAIARLRDLFWYALRECVEGIELNGATAQRHPGNLNVRVPNADARDVIQLLQPRVACSTGSACHSGSDNPSHILRAIGLNATDARASFRLSAGRFTTEDEILRAVNCIGWAIREAQARCGSALAQR